jgi:AcrR family transcriptional regulator
VVDALLDLLRAGNLRPTAREVAERAGVSLRSVYVHFDDVEDLFLAAAERQFELVAGLAEPVPATGPLADRAEAVVRVRGRLFEEIGAVRRAAELQEPFSPALARRLAAVRDAARTDLARVFAAELAPLPAADAARRFGTLDALASGATWDHLRRVSGLDPDAAARAVADAIVALLDRHP